MAVVVHVALTANLEREVESSRDHTEIGFLHKGNVPDPVYVRTDGPIATVNGDGAYTVLPGQQRWVPRLQSSGTPTKVSVISAGAANIEVEFSP